MRGSVYNGELDAPKMSDIAFKLHEEVGGSPLKGMGAGMRKILTGSSFLRFSQIGISSVGTLCAGRESIRSPGETRYNI